MAEKLKVCVIFGGQSPEHEISRKSVTSVINNLNKDKYDISVIGITKDGEWFLYTGDTANIENGDWENDLPHKLHAIISPDAVRKEIIVTDGGVKSIKPDIIFPVLHGAYGEDGTIQGLLEMSNIKYVGMGVLGSAVGMDKAFSKVVFADSGIPQANWVVVHTGEGFEKYISEIEGKLGYPCFVKPCNTGSSVGVGKAHDREELYAALAEAAKFDRKILVEEHIDGHEVECAVLGGNPARAAEVGEIVPTVEFYDFDAKYNDNSTQLHIPADISPENREKIREYAVKAFNAVDGMGLSRVDFFVRYSDNSVVLNEINTMPGFTNISMYPKLWDAVGMGYSELLDKLIELGLERVK